MKNPHEIEIKAIAAAESSAAQHRLMSMAAQRELFASTYRRSGIPVVGIVQAVVTAAMMIGFVLGELACFLH